MSPNATNEILRQKQRDISDYIDSKLALEVEKIQFMNQMKQQELGKNAQKEQIQEFEKKMQEKEARIMTPQDIEKKYTKYKSLKERAMHKLLQAMAVKNNLK